MTQSILELPSHVRVSAWPMVADYAGRCSARSTNRIPRLLTFACARMVSTIAWRALRIFINRK